MLGLVPYYRLTASVTTTFSICMTLQSQLQFGALYPSDLFIFYSLKLTATPNEKLTLRQFSL